MLHLALLLLLLSTPSLACLGGSTSSGCCSGSSGCGSGATCGGGSYALPHSLPIPNQNAVPVPQQNRYAQTLNLYG